MRRFRRSAGLKRAILLGGSICTVAAFLSSPASAEDEPIPVEEARDAFELVERLSAAEGSLLWGVELDGPILFVDPATRSVVANGPDGEGQLEERDGVFVGRLPDEEPIANTAVEWSGRRWTMLMWPLPESRYDRGRLLLHECFHRIQADVGLPANDPSNDHLDSMDGRIWLRMEWRALIEALIRDGEARRRAIEDALVFRARRASLFPGSVASEAALVRNEGLAEYTGWVASGLPLRVLPDRAAIDLERRERQDSFVRTFAYGSGPAYGLLLDEFDAGWRDELDSESDLSAMLARAVGLELGDDPASIADDRLTPYEGHRVLEQEKRREQRRLAQEDRDRARYLEGPVLILPSTDDARYSFDPRGIRPLGDHGTVYEPVRLTDAWGVLEADGGALLGRTAQGRLGKTRVPAPKDPAAELCGEGWTLELNPGWQIVPGDRAGDFVVRQSSPD